MIDCSNGDVRDVLPDFLHGRLDASRRSEVERHLAACEACREELSLLRDLRATLSRAPRVRVDAIAAAIPPYRAPVRRSWGTSWRAAAAIAAIAVGGTSIALLSDRRPTARDGAAPPVSFERDSLRARDSARGIAAVQPSAPASPGSERATPDVGSTRADAGELAMASGSIGELSDLELSALVDGLESLDALPSAEVEGTEPVGPGAEEGVL